MLSNMVELLSILPAVKRKEQFIFNPHPDPQPDKCGGRFCNKHTQQQEKKILGY